MNRLKNAIQEAQHQMLRLERHVGAGSAADAAAAPFAETAAAALAEASAMLEELRVAEEEMLAQNVALGHAQRRLERERERYAHLFEMAPDAYLVTDAHGLINEANHAAAEMLQVPARFLSGKPFALFVALEDRPLIRQRLLMLAREGDGEKGAAQGSDFVRITPRGKREWFEAALRSGAARNPRTREVTSVRWLLRDISDRALAEEERYHLLVESIADYAVFQITEDGQILSWNLGAERIFGYTEAEARQMSLADLHPPGPVAEMRETKERRLATAHGRAEESDWLRRKDGTLFWAEGVLARFPTGRRSAFFVKVLRDRTEQKRRQEGLRQSETRLRLALQAADAAPFEWHPRTNEVIWTPEYYALHGFDPKKDSPSFELWREAVHPDDRKKTEKAFAVAGEQHKNFSAEFRIVRADTGAVRWVMTLAQFLEGDGGRSEGDGGRSEGDGGRSEGDGGRVVGVTMDITRRKENERELQEARKNLEKRVRERTAELTKTNDALQKEMGERQRLETARQELLGRMVLVQEEERRRISRELHDQMGQHLAAFSLGLKALENAYPPETEAASLLGRLRDTAENLGQDVHRIAVQLRPTALDDLGLAKALMGYVENWCEQTEIACDFHASDAARQPLGEAVETTLYRVTQEALNNVAKHSSASRVSVLLDKDKQNAVLIVEDNGRGFDAAQTTGTNGENGASVGRLGLVGMRERVLLVGGTLTVESSRRSGGTTLFVRIPVAPVERQKESS